MTDKSFIAVLRWIAVIPAALIGQLIFSLIVPVTIGFAASYMDFESDGIIGTLVHHGAMSVSMAMSGSYTAPKFRKVTYVTLGLINLIAYIYLKYGTIEIIGCLIGLILSYTQVSDE